ncbi:hypothetical protein [Xenophilus azovorans]|uniref:hypothetical protein n=1 Tax=Xenophilus azovorans TaxID=151755 RepID=UPI0012EE3699|nr:hypothetical protein [Xenophilus azovorans]
MKTVRSKAWPDRRPKSAQDYGVYRQGDRVVVDLTRRGKRHRKAFLFSTHGGERQALRMARAWRDELITALPPQPRRDAAQRPRRDSKGIPGIFCRRDASGKPLLWTAHTLVAGKLLQKSFSVGRYGRQARQMAMAERARQLELMRDTVFLGALKGDAAALVQRHRREPSPIALDVPADLPSPSDVPTEMSSKHIKTGFAGVGCLLDREGRPRAWVARTRIGGVEQRKLFSIRKYGDDQALQLAIAERKRQLRRSRQLGTGR